MYIIVIGIIGIYRDIQSVLYRLYIYTIELNSIINKKNYYQHQLKY